MDGKILKLLDIPRAKGPGLTFRCRRKSDTQKWKKFFFSFVLSRVAAAKNQSSDHEYFSDFFLTFIPGRKAPRISRFFDVKRGREILQKQQRNLQQSQQISQIGKMRHFLPRQNEANFFLLHQKVQDSLKIQGIFCSFSRGYLHKNVRNEAMG